MATKPEKSEQTTNPAPQDRHDPEPPEMDIEERLSFPEARAAIADLEGQDQSLWISLPGMEQTELDGHLAEVPRTFLDARPPIGLGPGRAGIP